MKCVALLALAGAVAFAAPPIRIELVTGGHSHELSFYTLFQNQPEYAVTVDGHPSAFRQDLRSSTDVLVLYDLADVDAPGDRAHLRDFLEAGKGVVVLHHAIADNQKWPWWYEEVVGGRYLLQAEGDQRASTYQHDVPFTVRPVREHPVTRGLREFQIVDEAYKYMWHSPKIQVLLETDNPLNDRPLAWIAPYEKSRVVYIQLGHGHEAHESADYHRLIHNAIRWAAGRSNAPLSVTSPRN